MFSAKARSRMPTGRLAPRDRGPPLHPTETGRGAGVTRLGPRPVAMRDRSSAPRRLEVRDLSYPTSPAKPGDSPHSRPDATVTKTRRHIRGSSAGARADEDGRPIVAASRPRESIGDVRQPAAGVLTIEIPSTSAPRWRAASSHGPGHADEGGDPRPHHPGSRPASRKCGRDAGVDASDDGRGRVPWPGRANRMGVGMGWRSVNREGTCGGTAGHKSENARWVSGR